HTAPHACRRHPQRIATARSVDRSRESPALTGRLHARPDTPWIRANAARRAAHLVRWAPPSGCHHRAASDAQQLAVRQARARGDALLRPDGAPSPVDVRTGTADSLSPGRPLAVVPEGSHIPARETASRATSGEVTCPTRLRGARVLHCRS